VDTLYYLACSHLLTVDPYIAYPQFVPVVPVPQENRYPKLPVEEQKRCRIFGQNYGQAEGMDFFGARIGLPPGEPWQHS
jgi:hypothetical protein